MTFEPWHVPILVMAGILVLEIVTTWVRRRWRPRNWLRSCLYALLTVFVLAILVQIVGAQRAEQVKEVAETIATIAATWLAWLSYQLLREEKAKPTPADDSEQRTEVTPIGRR